MIAVTNYRPDIVLWSQSTRQVILVELTVPWDDRMEEAFESKKAKYQDRVDECREGGWRVWCLPVEVGCRGFVSQSTMEGASNHRHHRGYHKTTGGCGKEAGRVSITVDLEEES